MHKIDLNEYPLTLPNFIYPPSEDTFLLLEALKDIDSCKSFLEMGAGNAFISLILYSKFQEITLVDLDKKVINFLTTLKTKHSLKKFKILHSHLFTSLASKKYDVIVFNPPYVLSEKKQILSTDGGEEGVDVILPFLSSLKNHLSKNGVCFLLFSSLNNFTKIKNILKKNKLTYEQVVSKNIFFEKLKVIKISKII